MEGDPKKCSLLRAEAVTAFRLGLEGRGSEKLIAFIDSFLTLIQSFSQEKITETNHVLNQILAAQGRKDYLYVADLLEFRLVLR